LCGWWITITGPCYLRIIADNLFLTKDCWFRWQEISIFCDNSELNNYCEKNYRIWSPYYQFFYYNYLNNFNFNNKSDKIKILRTRMATRHWQWRLYFFYFSVFFLKKNWKTLVGVSFFPLVSGPTSNAHNSKLKKTKRCYSQWRLCTNKPVQLACLHSTTGSGSLTFVFIKFQFYHSYY
jgi:hypothetical protein